MSGLAQVGYSGQRYEVSCLGVNDKDPAERVVVGWTDLANGGALARMILKHPDWDRARIDDLRPEGIDLVRRRCCRTCGLAMAEAVACEGPDCDLETDEECRARFKRRREALPKPGPTVAEG